MTDTTSYDEDAIVALENRQKENFPWLLVAIAIMCIVFTLIKCCSPATA